MIVIVIVIINVIIINVIIIIVIMFFIILMLELSQLLETLARRELGESPGADPV